jgi:hypothetical protein
MTRTKPLVTGLLAVALASFGALESCRTRHTDDPPPAPVSVPASWATVRSTDDGFEVRMPHAPSEPPPRETGSTTLRSWRIDDGNGTRFGVLSFNFPRLATVGGDEPLLDVVRDRSVRGLDSAVTSERRFTVQGQNARDIAFASTIPGETRRGVLRIVRGRSDASVFVLMVVPHDGDAPEEDVRRFFDSFRLVP